MATIDATEAHNHIDPAHMESFKDALAEAKREGRRITSVVIANGVPIVYNSVDE